ncbi:MAG: NAD(P)-dependent oxidoreductase [Bacilli bacterium]
MEREIKSAVITGATGMLGISLIEILLEQKIYCLAIVRSNSNRVKYLPKSKYLTVLECDISKYQTIDIETQKKYDAFFHFAWNGTVGNERSNYVNQINNIQYTLDALELAKKFKCKIFIGAGSLAEYGQVNHVISPDTPVNPESGYGIAKYAAGKFSAIKAKELNLEFIWMRIFSVYGPYNIENSMIISVIKSLIKEKKASLSKGSQMWDYLYSKDAALAFLKIAKKGKDQSIYCIGSGESKPISEYAMILKNTLNESLILEFGKIPYSENQIMYLCSDISLLTKDTGFSPMISFEQGIRETIEWVQTEMCE